MTNNNPETIFLLMPLTLLNLNMIRHSEIALFNTIHCLESFTSGEHRNFLVLVHGF